MLKNDCKCICISLYFDFDLLPYFFFEIIYFPTYLKGFTYGLLVLGVGLDKNVYICVLEITFID